MIDSNHEHDDGRYRFWLIAAVVVAMVFVFGAWLWLLPYQLHGNGSNDPDSSDWDSIRFGLDQEAADFMSSLDTLGGSLNVPPSSLTDETDDEEALKAQEVAARLQEKLTAAETTEEDQGDSPAEESIETTDQQEQ